LDSHIYLYRLDFQIKLLHLLPKILKLNEMKNLVVALLVIFAVACKPQKQESFVIHGTIKGLTQKMAYLERYKDGNWEKIDSSLIDTLKGKFELKGKLESPELLYINFGKGQSVRLFVENAQIEVKGDSIQNVKKTGSKSQNEFQTYIDKSDSINKDLNELNKKYSDARKAGDTVTMKKLDEQFDKLSDDVEKKDREFSKNFVKQNKASFVSPFILWSRLSYEMEVGEMDSLVKGFDTTLNKSGYVKLLNERIEILKKVAVGKPAPDFTMNDTLGNPVKLSSLFGKYLLIDFWASWCGPCRRENPNVVAAFKEYNKKGFDILGVSLDRDKGKWTTAIKKDKLTWHHVSDLQYWNNEAAKQYGIRSIPSNLLLDQKGVIIAKNLRGEDLTKKLKDLLK
jgi:peroxiredoxin